MKILAGVVGSPIGHSLSPLIHNAWLEGAGVDGAYLPFDVPPHRFPFFVEGLRGGVSALGALSGLNVTAPHKERALTLADEADDAAQAAGAANLLLFARSGRIEARNTDGRGLLAAFIEHAPERPPEGAVVVILGAGGAARSAAVTMRQAGAAEIRIVNRTLERAQGLAHAVAGTAFPWPDVGGALRDAEILINATTLGREGGEPLDIPLGSLHSGAAVMDMVYRPLRTPLLEEAARRGLTPVDGLAMLIGQAVPSFEAFYGRPPPPIDVRSLALGALA